MTSRCPLFSSRPQAIHKWPSPDEQDVAHYLTEKIDIWSFGLTCLSVSLLLTDEEYKFGPATQRNSPEWGLRMIQTYIGAELNDVFVFQIGQFKALSTIFGDEEAEAQDKFSLSLQKQCFVIEEPSERSLPTFDIPVLGDNAIKV